VQAIVAAGQRPDGAEWSKGGNTPRGFVASMQASDGSFCWMEGVVKNPVWTTAYAACALSGKPYPIGISYSDPPGGGGSGESAENTGGGTAASPTAPAAGGEGQTGSGEEADGSPEAQGEAIAQETQGGETDGTDTGEEARAAAGASSGSEDGGEGSGGISFLAWSIPLAVAVPLLLLGGWRLYKRRSGAEDTRLSA
jgi:hypothetical protein